jgi:phage baseplate assembly protein W
MNGPRYRAWRFLHPDIEAAEGFAGLCVDARGAISMVEGDASIRQAILLLLSTAPGERIMRPGYGCLLHRLIFSPNDDTTAGLAIYYVRQAIAAWEPRVDIVRLDAGRDPDAPERLDVTLVYRARATQRVEELTYTLDLTGVAR